MPTPDPDHPGLDAGLHATVDALTRTAVFLDFDGTISATDTGLHLLVQCAVGDWRSVDDRYTAGEIGSRECLQAEWALLPPSEQVLREVAAEIPLDPEVDSLVAALAAAGAEVVIVSDGFGFNVHEQLDHLGIPIITNEVDWSTGALEFPNGDPLCECAGCGTCKRAPIQDAARRGLRTVLVGDGVSDRRAATVADVVFAKDGLAKWCAEMSLPYEPFTTLADVRVGLFGR